MIHTRPIHTFKTAYANICIRPQMRMVNFQEFPCLNLNLILQMPEYIPLFINTKINKYRENKYMNDEINQRVMSFNQAKK